MMKSETYAKIIKWGLYLSLLLPLFVSRRFYYPFVFPRTAVFRMIIEIIFILWLILIIKDRRYLPPKNAVFWSLAVLAGIFVLTSFTSVDPTRSFMGSMERGSGTLTWLHYCAFFIILTGVFRQKKDWFNFFNWSVGASFLVSLYALAQRLGLQSVYESGVDRATGTIGNAAFLATYLILNAGIALILLFARGNEYREKTGWKIFYYSAIFLNALAIYLTETRGAVLGILAGFFFFALVYIFFAPGGGFRQSKAKKYLAIALLVVIILSASLWMFRDSGAVKSIPGLSRLATISISEATAQSRILAWQTSWQVWKEKSLLGWGPENFNIAFNEYFNAEFYKYGRGETWFDRAHNIIFDTGTTSGVLGLAAYLAVFATAFRALWLYRKKDFLAAVIMASLLVAYFTQNLLVFDVFNSYLIFFLVLAFISFLNNGSLVENKNSAEGVAPPIAKQRGKTMRRPGELGAFAVIGLAILSLVMLAFFWEYNYKTLAAGFWSAQAFQNANQPQGKAYLADQQKADSAFTKIMGLYEKTFSYQTYGDPEMRTDFIGFVFDNADNANISQKTREKEFAFALGQAEQSISSHPLNARWYLLEAKLLQGYSQVKKEGGEDGGDLLKKSEEAIRKGISLSPPKIALRYILVQTLMLSGKNQEALDTAKETISFYPESPDSYWYLGLAYVGVDDETSALKAIDTSLDYGYSFQNMGDLKLAADFCSQKNDLLALEKIYRQAITLDGKNLQWYASLATVYSRLGQKDKAIETANKILEIDPDSRPEVEEFIKGL